MINNELYLGIILAVIIFSNSLVCEIKDELKHAKKLLHLQNDITNQLLIELTNQNKKRNK